jgi:hypothetical protein
MTPLAARVRGMWTDVWQAIASLDWKAFIPQLLAALVAAGIGIVGVVWAFRAQRRASYVDSVDNAAVRVVEEVTERAVAIRQYQHDIAAFEFLASSALIGGGPNPMPVKIPSDFTLDTAIDIALMRARGDDQKMILDVQHAYRAIREASLERQLEGLGMFGGAISRWRSQIWEEDRVRSTLSQIQDLVNRA